MVKALLSASVVNVTFKILVAKIVLEVDVSYCTM